MSAFLDALQAGVLIGDGALGSELFKKGLQAGDAPEVWNVEFPDRVQAVHQSYIDAGSRLVLTNTFGGNGIKMEMAGLAERAEELNRAAVELLKAIRPEGVFIGGDLGPTGDFMEPVGLRSKADFVETFKKQAQVLADAGADVLIVETMGDVGEVCAAVEGAKAAADLPVIASMTFEQDAGGDDYHSMMGITIEQYVSAVEAAGADVIGTNCGKGAHETAGVALKIKSLTDKPVMAFPNAGVPRIEQGETVYDQSPEVMQPHYKAMIDGGIKLIGGCCGTTPEHIAALKSLIG